MRISSLPCIPGGPCAITPEPIMKSQLKITKLIHQKSNIYPLEENNFIVRSYRFVILATRSVTRRTIKAMIIFVYKNIENLKSAKIKLNRLTMGQLVHLILTIDKVHRAPKMDLDCQPSLVRIGNTDIFTGKLQPIHLVATSNSICCCIQGSHVYMQF